MPRYLMLFALLGFALPAQVTTADIVGTAVDGSGAVIPNANVKLVNLATNIQRAAATAETGEFVFNLLPPGRYSVRVEKQGFKSYTVPELQVAVGDRSRIEAKMMIGDTAETIMVTGDAPLLQSDSSVIGTAITGKLVQDLPLNGRNYIQLAQLVPGVSPGPANGLATGTRPDDRRLNSSFSVNGQDPVVNNNMIDGMDNNERFIGTIGVRPSIDAIQEFKVLTSMYSAEISRTSGGVVNILTKAGGNEIHGTLFEFLRNDVLDANGNYNLTGGTQLAKQKFRQNQFGGSVGGPIRKDKTFFFGDFESLRIRQGIPITATVPTAKQAIGDFSENCTAGFSAAGICATAGQQLTVANATGTAPAGAVPFNRLDIAPYRAQLDTLAGKISALYPLPTGPGINTTNYASSPVRPQNANTFDARVDHSLNPNWNLFGRYSFNDVTTTQPTGFPDVNGVNPGGLFAFAGTNATRAQNIQLNSVKAIRPNLLLELKAGFTRTAIQSKTVNDGKNTATTVGFPCNAVSCVNTGDEQTFGLPRLLIQGFQELGDAVFVPLLLFNNTFQYSGSVTWNRGSHNWKFGANLIRRQFSPVQSASARGTFTFNASTGNAPAPLNNGYANFLLGVPVTINRTTSLYKPGYRGWETGFYVQDDWRVNGKLTLNIGIRHDVYTAKTEVYDRMANFDPLKSLVLVAGQNGSRTADITTDFGSIAPRFGFAATLGKGTVLRGGFGLSYFPGDYASGVALKNPPFTAALTCGPLTTGSLTNTGCPAGIGTLAQGSPIPLPPSGFPTANGALDLTRIPPSSMSAVDFDFQASLNYQFNVTLEKQMGANVVSLAYIGTRGRNLPMALGDINRALPSGAATANVRPYAVSAPRLTTIGYFAFQGTAAYNSMQLSFNRRLARGFSFTSGYTLANGQDNITGLGTSTGGYGNMIGPFAQAIENVKKYDWATSDFNVRHRFALGGNYELPYGKSLRGPTAVLLSGWQLNGIVIWQTGLPFTVTGQTAVSGIIGVGGGAERPNRLRSDIRMATPTIGSSGQWLDPAAFAAPAGFTLGNAPRNVGFGPNQTVVNSSMFKTFQIKERYNLQFRSEFFNVANHPFFDRPQFNNLGNPNFGKITAVAGNYSPRQIQFAVKLLF